MFGRRVMICQPTTGRTTEEILEDRNRMIAIVERAMFSFKHQTYRRVVYN